jgi:tRNA(adenine34) deaminase
MTDEDERYMRRALALAERAASAGEVPVGAVLVSGLLVVEACNEKESRADATAHAEILALQSASHHLGTWRLEDAILYVTKEPCVMCAGAMIAARIKRLVYGANDPKGGADGGAFDILRSRGTNHRIEIEAGVLQSETAAQLQRFFLGKRGSRGSEGIEPAAP